MKKLNLGSPVVTTYRVLIKACFTHNIERRNDILLKNKNFCDWYVFIKRPFSSNGHINEEFVSIVLVTNSIFFLFKNNFLFYPLIKKSFIILFHSPFSHSIDLNPTSPGLFRLVFVLLCTLKI